MDIHVVDRDRVQELAIIEELSGPPRPVRAADRRWMLAMAGIAAIVCMGFAGDLVSPQQTDQPAHVDMAQASGDPSASPIEPAPPIDVEVLSVDRRRDRWPGAGAGSDGTRPQGALVGHHRPGSGGMAM